MNFDLTEEQTLLQRTAREFAEKELAPRAAEIDRTASIPREILDKMGALGFMGMTTPEALGGAGLDNFSLTLVQMEINRACASTGVTMSVQNSLFQGPLNRFGTEEQKKRILPDVARGRQIGAYSLSEPGSGTDAGALVTAAARDGEDYVVNGSKNFVTNGGLADLFICYVRTNPDPAVKHDAISAILIDRSTPGLTVGKPEKKMGIRGSSTTSLFFQDCRVPRANLIGREGEGFKIAMDTLDGGRIGIAAQAVGIARACLDASVKHAREREQFGRPIGHFQAIQWKLAAMAVDIDAATLLTLRAALLRDAGKPHAKEASMAKLFASTMANDHAGQAVQIHGGSGYIKDLPVERHFRDAKITEIYEGTNEVQKMVIARSLLK